MVGHHQAISGHEGSGPAVMESGPSHLDFLQPASVSVEAVSLLDLRPRYVVEEATSLIRKGRVNGVIRIARSALRRRVFWTSLVAPSLNLIDFTDFL